jgi:hypothetical protein
MGEGVRQRRGCFWIFAVPTRVTAERALCWFNKHIREQSVGAKPMGFLDSVQRVQIKSPLALGICGRSTNYSGGAANARRRSVLDLGRLKPPARAD